jgi:hypothetical protein
MKARLPCEPDNRLFRDYPKTGHNADTPIIDAFDHNGTPRRATRSL